MEAPEAERAEVDVPLAVVHLDQADVLLAQSLADIDPLFVPADATVAADAADLVVARVLLMSPRRTSRPSLDGAGSTTSALSGRFAPASAASGSSMEPGLATTTSSRAVASAATRGTSYPPVASQTIRVGPSTWQRATSSMIPVWSFGRRSVSPGGRHANSSWALATSTPMNDIGTSHWNGSRRPHLAGCGLPAQATVRALGEEGVRRPG